jgi:hypothetical protein
MRRNPTFPKSYHKQEGCRYYYCTRLSPRPKCCCSVAMKDSFLDLPKKEQHKASMRWHKWADRHEVAQYGICNYYRREAKYEI